MPNQMIALQARSPQLPSAAAQTAKFVNMMNMTKQQEAAERQAAQAQQAMTLAQRKDAREEALQGPALTKAGAEANSARLKYVMDYYKSSANDLSTARDPQDVIARAERLKRLFPEPELNASIDETVASMPQDPALFSRWRDDTLRRTMDAEKQLKRDYSNMFDAEGRLIIVETSPVGAFSPKVTALYSPVANSAALDGMLGIASTAAPSNERSGGAFFCGAALSRERTRARASASARCCSIVIAIVCAPLVSSLSIPQQTRREVL